MVSCPNCKKRNVFIRLLMMSVHPYDGEKGRQVQIGTNYFYCLGCKSVFKKDDERIEWISKEEE